MKLSLAFLFVVTGSILSAQTFVLTPPLHPLKKVSSGSVKFSDVDGDGDPDLMISGYNKTNIAELYYNEGGEFTKSNSSEFEGVNLSEMAFEDIDGDGDEDLIITGRKSSQGLPIATLYQNNQGQFSRVTGTPFKGVYKGSIAFSDIDNDGDPDVLISGIDSSSTSNTTLYTNHAGQFTEVSGTPFEHIHSGSTIFSDIDNDGDEDLFITGYNAQSWPAVAKLYTNQGRTFTEVVGTPFVGSGYEISAAFADLDSDGYDDLFISHPTRSKVYMNDGSGQLLEVLGPEGTGMKKGKVNFEDVDGDGDLDLLITGAEGLHYTLMKLFLNDGSGNFTHIENPSLQNAASYSSAFADIDQDNDKDLVVTGGYQLKIFLNDGAGNLLEKPKHPIKGVIAGDMVFFDADNDGDEDLLTTGFENNNIYDAQAILYINDQGSFTKVEATPFEGVKQGTSSISDIDNDGDLDIFMIGDNAQDSSTARLYANNGTGTFTEIATPNFKLARYKSAAFADIDGDGDEDLFIGGYSSNDSLHSKLYENIGGIFTELLPAAFHHISTELVAFSDIDGDQDLDLILTGESLLSTPHQVSQIYKNDGAGIFSLFPGTTLPPLWRGAIALSDVDNDGDEDLVICGLNNSDSAITKLYLNLNGEFFEVATPLFTGIFQATLAFADVDGDNDEDLLLTGWPDNFSTTTQLYLNQKGYFLEAKNQDFVTFFDGMIAFSDIDGDQDPDFVIAGNDFVRGNTTRIYINESWTSSIEQESEIANFAFRLFPNPVSSNHITLTYTLVRNSSLTINIFDIKGNLVTQRFEYAQAGQQQSTIDLPNLPTGIYMIQIDDGQSQSSQKFMFHTF